MSKKSFYSLCRYTDKTDGVTKTGYIMRDGENVPNDLGFDLGVYRAKDSSAATNWEEVKTWLVVDTCCGLSVGQGSTKKEAIEIALKRLAKVDMVEYEKARQRTKDSYGECPGHKIAYL